MQAKLGASDVVQEPVLHTQLGFIQFVGDQKDEFKSRLRTILANEIHMERRKYDTQKRRRDRAINIQADLAVERSLYDAEMTPGTSALLQEKLDTGTGPSTLRLNLSDDRMATEPVRSKGSHHIKGVRTH